jgi:hypothetical protein
MSDRLFEALEVCIGALETGVSLEACLSLYPELKSELQPALEAAQAARSLATDQAPPDVLLRSRKRVLEHAAELRPKKRLRSRLGLPTLAYASLTVAAALLLASAGLIAASAQTLPGDALYPVKRAAESLSLSAAPGQNLKQSLKANYSERRLEEARNLVKLGRPEEVRFVGTLTQMGPEAWVVDDLRVVLTPETILDPQIETGMGVEVLGRVNPGGWISADEVRLKTFRLSGTVEKIEAEAWTVDGNEINIHPLTLIESGIRVGDQVLMLVQVEADDSWTTLAILRLEGMKVPTSTSTPASTEEDPDEFEIELTGIVESMTAASWQIGNRTIAITPGTELEGDIALGDRVKVHARVALDGSTTALKIELLEGDETDEVDEETGDEPEEETPEPTEEREDGGEDSGDDGDEPPEEGEEEEEKEELEEEEEGDH